MACHTDSKFIVENIAIYATVYFFMAKFYLLT